MNKYEITTITKEDQKDSPVKKEIETLGGKVLETNQIGQRKMIFPIKKETAGYYTVVLFEIDPEKVLELNKKLALNPEILRFLILTAVAAKTTLPKVVKKEEKALEEIKEAPLVKVAEEEKVEEKPKAEKKVEKEVAKPEAPAKPSEPEKKVAKKPVEPVVVEKPKISPAAKEIESEEMSAEERLKALDKKLDELLKE